MKTLKEILPHEVIIYKLAQEIINTHGDRVDSMDLIEDNHGDYEFIKIYHGKGHCFDLTKEYICDIDDVENYENVYKDGYCYTFCEPWDGFTQIGIEKAIKLLNEYAKIEN